MELLCILHNVVIAMFIVPCLLCAWDFDKASPIGFLMMAVNITTLPHLKEDPWSLWHFVPYIAFFIILVVYYLCTKFPFNKFLELLGKL